MLTTEIAIDQNEYDSVTGTAGIINQSNRAVQAGDHIHFDVTSAGNSALGLVISFTFQPV
jgi:urease beta subunit